MLPRIAHVIRTLSLGIWLGGLIATAVAAVTIFKTMDNRTMAGQVASAVFHTANLTLLCVALVALLAQAVLFFSATAKTGPAWRRFGPAAFLLGAMALMLLMVLWLEPHLRQMQLQIGDFSPRTLNDPQRQQFRILHSVSVGLVVLEAFCVGMALAISALPTRDEKVES
ncbi:MAG TPA: DUF4149 domain-containing protein [Planctomycetota bacterium]|jgi:hypothetical protein